MEIRTIPGSDAVFRARVEAALGDRTFVRPDRFEDALRRALERIRDRYPYAWFREQDSLAAEPERPCWYIFRDPRPRRDPYPARAARL